MAYIDFPGYNKIPCDFCKNHTHASVKFYMYINYGYLIPDTWFYSYCSSCDKAVTGNIITWDRVQRVELTREEYISFQVIDEVMQS